MRRRRGFPRPRRRPLVWAGYATAHSAVGVSAEELGLQPRPSALAELTVRDGGAWRASPHASAIGSRPTEPLRGAVIAGAPPHHDARASNFAPTDIAAGESAPPLQNPDNAMR